MSEAAPNSVAERLAAELEADTDAELVDGGSFDIDADKALDKLGRFQLADPCAYVLRLVEAGLLAGAETIRFDITRRELRASFEGGELEPIPKRVLERLLSVLIGRDPTEQSQGPREGPAREVLLDLAIAVVSNLPSSPIELSIESVGPDRRGYRQIFAGRGRSTLEEVEGGDPGLRFVLIDPGHDAVGERDLLLSRASGVEAELLLDGDLISGYPTFGGALGTAPVRGEGPGELGEAGFFASREPGRLYLLSRGLWIETVTPAGLSDGFVARVEAGSLARDLSRTKLVRGPELDAIYEAVRKTHDELRPSCEEQLEVVKRERGEAKTSALVMTVFGVCSVVVGLDITFIEEERTPGLVITGLGLCMVIYYYLKFRMLPAGGDSSRA